MKNTLFIKRYYKKCRKIEGWFDPVDALIFKILSDYQISKSITGDILEIGVYKGKSAVFLGKLLQTRETFFAADLFDSTAENLSNIVEVDSSYLKYNAAEFSSTFHKYTNIKAEILMGDSINLYSKIESNRFRLIHVDGSHLFENFSIDLENAMKTLQVDGIIAIDDYRSYHTPGVSMKLWSLISKHELYPIVCTKRKMYLQLAPVETDLSEYITHNLAILKIESENEQLGDISYLRLINIDWQFKLNFGLLRRILKLWTPPIFLNLKNFLRKTL